MLIYIFIARAGDFGGQFIKTIFNKMFLTILWTKLFTYLCLVSDYKLYLVLLRFGHRVCMRLCV